MIDGVKVLSGGVPLLGHALEFAGRRVALLGRAQTELGDALGQFRLGPMHNVIVSRPDHVHKILVEDAYAFEKSVFYHYLKRLLGLGLVTSEGDFHRRQRKLVAPLMQPKRIATYAATMSSHSERAHNSWNDGEVIDVQREMMRLTLGIVGKTLFDAELLDEADALGPALDEANHYVGTEIDQMVHLPMWWPTPRIARARRAIARIDETIMRLIAERRKSGEDKGDILSLLMAARHEGESTGLTDMQIRDEAITMFAAGHETTALALTWALYLLAKNPEAAARLRNESQDVLQGREPLLEDLPRLPYAMQVFKESMRLYPPAYVVGRKPVADYTLDGHTIPSRSMILVNIYGMHRRPDVFPDPERFDPDRFTPENEKKIPRYAYLPFGSGPRICVGNHFALMEGQLILASLAQRISLELESNELPRTQPLITLRARDGVRARVVRLTGPNQRLPSRSTDLLYSRAS